MAVSRDYQFTNLGNKNAAKFPLVRWLSLTSLLAMMLTAAVLILLYRQDQLAVFEKIAKEDNERVLLHLVYSLDSQISSFVTSCNGLDSEALKFNPNLDSLFASSLDQIKEHDILKLKLYNLSGTVIFSSVKNEIGGTGSDSNLLAKALGGESVSHLDHRDKFLIARTEMRNVNIFETYMPLFHEGKQIGVIESYNDAAPFIERLQSKIFQIILIVLCAFAGLYIALFYSVLKADKAIGDWQIQTKKIDEIIHKMAFYDSLTHLPNRHLLYDRIAQAIATSNRSGSYSALLFLDLDNFKPLNDTNGHRAGDFLLVEVARRIISCVREVDTVARFGGDEFVVVLSELDSEKNKSNIQAVIVAEKIRSTLSEPYVLNLRDDGKLGNSIEHRCTASIGVVIFSNKESIEDILKWADMAMYQSKAAGRNLIRFYEDQV